MPYRTLTSTVPYLVIAGLGASLLGGSVASWAQDSAQERITLESIGAVRMATAGEVHRPDARPRHGEASAIRETQAERASRPR